MSDSSSSTPASDAISNDALMEFLAEGQAEQTTELVTEDALAECLGRIRDNRLLKEELEARVKAVNKALEIDQGIALTYFDAKGIRNMRMQAGGTFYINERMFPRVLDPEQFITWLDGVGDGALAKRSVHPQTLRSYYASRLKDGADLPPKEVVEAYLDRQVRFRKS